MSSLALAMIIYGHFASIFICGGLIVSGKLDLRQLGLWPQEESWCPPAILALIPVLNWVLIGFWVKKALGKL